MLHYNANTRTWFLFGPKAQFNHIARQCPAAVTEPPLDGDLAEVVQDFWDIGWTCVDT